MPNNLIVKMHSLVNRVLFQGTKAVGVEYLEGNRLYRADPIYAEVNPTEPILPTPAPQQLFVTREVILAGGVYNTPQMLKLSGIGPAAELQSLGITPIVDRPGVGTNLQDRYEVGIVTKMKNKFTHFNACTGGAPGDPCGFEWFTEGAGPYRASARPVRFS